jgi:acetone carboxylase alpha subunit
MTDDTPDDGTDRKADGGVSQAAPVAEDERSIEAEMTEFLEGEELFEGPDREIMEQHSMEPRTDRQEAALDAIADEDVTRMVVNNQLQAIGNEGLDMAMQIASSPGAKWGDLITGLFTREGDLAVASSSGVLSFIVLQGLPIKHVMKKWRENPDYEINEGDVFHHMDARYGNIHNADQSTFIPVFDGDEHIAWASCVIHEGENGSTEPGGIPGDAESPYDEGLKTQPMKIGTDYELDEELITFFQNSTRDKKLTRNDHQARLASVMRMIDRIDEVIDQYGADHVVGGLRHSLESAEEEMRARIEATPDGTYRHTTFADSTLKEDCLIKIPCEITIEGDEITIDYRGAGPEFDDRATNAIFASLKSVLMPAFLNFIWPDLPRNQAIFEPVHIEADRGSIVHCTREVPNAQSMMTLFPAFSSMEQSMMKALYPEFTQENRSEATDIHANHYNCINGWTYGGTNQHGDFVGNIVTDINTMPGAARWDRDGLHSQAAFFCAMGDMGETEHYEEEYPFVALSRARLLKDLQGFGRYRGGHGHQQVFTHKDTPAWAWLATGIGSRFPSVHGLYGGYGAPAIPAGRIKDANVLELLEEDPEDWEYDIPDLMQEKPLDGEYTTWDLGLQQELAEEGEVYWVTQGAGGGLGDPIERDAESVLEDLEKDLISEWVLENIYEVAYDEETMMVDEAATEERRESKREQRLEEGVPFDEFVDDWETETPPLDMPYFGSWDDREEIYAGWVNQRMAPDELEGMPMNFFRTQAPALFDTPKYPPRPEYKGDLSDD